MEQTIQIADKPTLDAIANNTKSILEQLESWERVDNLLNGLESINSIIDQQSESIKSINNIINSI